MKRISIFGAALLLLVNSGCSVKKITTNTVGKIARDGMIAVEGEEDLILARESAPALIKTIEVLRQGNPKDYNSLVVLSESYGLYAFGFLEEDMLARNKDDAEYVKIRNRADMFYRRGREYGIAALIGRGMGRAFNSNVQDFKKALDSMGKKDVGGLFWTAFNWANYLNLHLDDPNVIVDLPRIEAMIDRVIAIDPGFYCGSAYTFKGIIESMRPRMLGGNPALADEKFRRAMEIAPDYLMTKVLYAQYYARQMQDVGLFRSTLSDVQSADASKLPAQRLANELAKRRAKLLMDSQKKLF